MVSHSLPKTVAFAVDGVPETEGSTRAYTDRTGTARVRHTKAHALNTWRDRVRAAALAAAAQVRWPAGWDGPVEVRAVFWLPRPRTVRAALPAVKPDLDKLARAVGDAITEERYRGMVSRRGLVCEDSRIVRWVLEKRYADEETGPGVSVAVLAVDEEVES